MRPVVLKLLKQEPVTQNEWHDLFFSVHTVCLWDEKGGSKVIEALKEDITNFIKQAQQVKIYHEFIMSKMNGICVLIFDFFYREYYHMKMIKHY